MKTKKGRKREIQKRRNEKKSKKISYKPIESNLEPSKLSSLISISNESSELTNFINKGTRIFLVIGHSYAYSQNPNLGLRNPVKIKYDMKYFSKERANSSKFKDLSNFRHLIMQKKGNPNMFRLINMFVNMINYYENFYKKIVECDDNNKAKKLNKELLKYGNLRDKKFIDKKKYQEYVELLQNTGKMITTFKLYSKNSNDKLPQRIFEFMENVVTINEKIYFDYKMNLFGIFELTNLNPDINSYEIINFFQSEEAELIFTAQIARFKFDKITVLDLLQARLRIPNQRTIFLLSKMGLYGITIINYLNKISNFNRLILEKYKNIIKNIILVKYPDYKDKFLPDSNEKIDISNSEETIQNMFNSSSSSEETMENMFNSNSEEKMENFSELKKKYNINYLSKRLGLKKTEINMIQYIGKYQKIKSFNLSFYKEFKPFRPDSPIKLYEEWIKQSPNINDYYLNEFKLKKYFDILLSKQERFNIKEIYELIINNSVPELNSENKVLVIDGGCNSYIDPKNLNSVQKKQVSNYYRKMNSNK